MSRPRSRSVRGHFGMDRCSDPEWVCVWKPLSSCVLPEKPLGFHPTKHTRQTGPAAPLHWRIVMSLVDYCNVQRCNLACREEAPRSLTPESFRVLSNAASGDQRQRRKFCPGRRRTPRTGIKTAFQNKRRPLTGHAHANIRFNQSVKPCQYHRQQAGKFVGRSSDR